MRPPPPQALVIAGASGDLTRRKVLPALYHLFEAGLLPESSAIVGAARTPYDDDRFRAEARTAVETFHSHGIHAGTWKRFEQMLFYVPGSYDELGAFEALEGRVADLERARLLAGRLYYLATPPSAFEPIIERLEECGVRPDWRVVVEKPFGRDLDSARELNRTIRRVLAEEQIFRIDHYLGKETVQNILVFRFANAMFERVWHRDAIDHVQITVAESVGVGSRAAFYEEAGAMRDMVQNHLLQVLCFIAMEPPRSLEAEAILDEKVKVLRAMKPLSAADVVRGQYHRGRTGGDPVPGYREEPGVRDTSRVETFVAVRASVDNWRWSGVPFFLRTGKRLPRRATEASIVFREPPAYLFEAEGMPCPPADELAIRIQPEEGISFCFQAKEPGPGFEPRTVEMAFDYDRSFDTEPLEAYERLLYDAMMGDRTLFLRADGVERAWEIVAPVLDLNEEPEPYGAGTWGPDAATRLIAPRAWRLED